MNFPNLLTILRIFFVPLLVVALVQGDFGLRVMDWPIANEFLALGIFLAAAVTDLLDGYLARRWKQVTTVGTLLDPIADKMLISAALISLVQVRVIPGWIAILIIGREFAVTGLRGIAAAEGYTIKASDLGKTKMVFQVIAISLLLFSMRDPAWHGWAMLWMYGVVVFGIASAIQYFLKFWNGVDERTKLRRRRELLALEKRQKRQELVGQKVGSTAIHR
ncbi:MAG TPA: CDP-diacylglycerol--glycerol-3-phosphate 3-phosphatidyltransferase [Bryobacteraceae bacterium]|nr:CDP-diacylglycerol--glycerol-3-phosphate 3-phosphatidyltransferase [Bryobacteraceae bacterium]